MVFLISFSETQNGDKIANENNIFKYCISNTSMMPKLAEWHIYGNEQQGRFAIRKAEKYTYFMQDLDYDIKNRIFTKYFAIKSYEVKDHLGNVRAMLADYKRPNYYYGVYYPALPQSPYYTVVDNLSEYYPGGMPITTASPTPAEQKQRYGYNAGAERDNDIFSNQFGRATTTFYREGDTYTMRWWGVDPKAIDQPWQSSYSYMNENVIRMNDPLGDCPPCAAAAIGAGLDIAFQTIDIVSNPNKTFKKDFSITSVFVSAGTSALGVGIASKLGKVAQLITNPKVQKLATVASGMIVDASMSVTSQVSKQYLDGKEISVNFNEVKQDVISGFVGGKLADKIGPSYVPKTEKLLKESAKQTERKVAQRTRQASKDRITEAYAKVENFITTKTTGIATAASASIKEGYNKLKSWLTFTPQSQNKKNDTKKTTQ